MRRLQLLGDTILNYEKYVSESYFKNWQYLMEITTVYFVNKQAAIESRLYFKFISCNVVQVNLISQVSLELEGEYIIVLY